MKIGTGHKATGNSQRIKSLAFALCALLFGLSLSAEAQQTNKVPRIGVLNATSAASLTSRMAQFQKGLRELGYIDGKNVTIEYRYADGQLSRLPELAAELV